MSDVHLHFHFPQPDGETLSLLRRIIMDQAQLKTELEAVSTALATVGDQLTAGEAQLGKALDEIIVAIGNSGQTTPAVDAALQALKDAAAALGGKGAAIATTAQALDDLNPDVAPAP